MILKNLLKNITWVQRVSQYFLHISLNLLLCTIFLLIFTITSVSSASSLLGFKGVNKQDLDSLSQKIPGLFRGQFDLSDIDEALRFLIATKRYSGASCLLGDDGSYTIIAASYRKITEIQVTGSKFLSKNEILELLNIQKGDDIQPEQIEASLKRILDRYEEVGHLNAKINLDVLDKTSGQTLIVKIEEGPVCEIERILFKSENQQLNSELNKKLKPLLTKPLTEERLVEIKTRASEVFKESRYLTARLSDPTIDYNSDKSKAKITFAIEKSDRYEFFFEGNKEVLTSDLYKSFKVETLVGTSLNPGLEVEVQIKNLYLKRGFSQVQVKSDEKKSENSSVRRVYFTVLEGEKTRLKDLKFTVKMSGREQEYTSFIKDHSSPLVKSGYYNLEDLQEATKKLVDKLQNEGYLRAQMVSIRTQMSSRFDSATVTIHLDEGPRTIIQTVEFENNKSFSSVQLRDSIGIQINQPLKLVQLEESLSQLRTFYRSQGFLEMDVLNESKDLIQYNNDNTLAIVKFKIHEGPQVKVQSLKIDGNTFTKSYVITNELDFKEGDILTPKKVQDSIFRLQKMGLFSKVDIVTLEQNSEVSNRTVIVQVSERDPGLFYAGLGFTNENQFTYRGYVGQSYRNILGTARAISLRLDAKYSTLKQIDLIENRVTASYLEPYLFGSRTRGRFTLERNVEVFQLLTEKLNSDFERRTSIIQENNEARSYIEHEFGRNSKFIWNLYTFSNLKFFKRFDPKDPQTLNIATIGPLLELDYRNDIVNPTAGHYSRYEVEYSDPFFGSSKDSTKIINYIRTTANFTHYQSFINADLVWVNTLRGGYLANISPDPRGGVPAVKAFFLGTQNTIRGFNPGVREFVPSPSQLGVENLTDFYVRADSHFYLLKTEFRYHLFGNLFGAVFYDGGAVLISGLKDQKGLPLRLADPYRDATGFGVRYLTPVGAVSLELGLKLDRKENESPFAIHFSIGNF